MRTAVSGSAPHPGWFFVVLLGCLTLLQGQVIPMRKLPGSVVAPVTARGISGQFVVSGAAISTPRPGAIPEMSADAVEVELEPQWLAVAAERTKRAVLARFNLSDRWQGKIHLYIRPKRELGNAPIRIVPVSFPGGWQFRVDVPDRVEWRRLVRALVEVVVLELANREVGDQVGLPPLWLNEGLSFLVIADQGRDLVLQGNTSVLRNQLKPSLLNEARQRLAGKTPLLFSELSFPSDSLGANPEAWAVFQASSALLMHELLLEESGRQSMARFLGSLPRHLNWQTGFIEAHRPRFLSPLDVEKWWAVNSAHVLGRDPSLLWTPETTLAQLSLILVESAEFGGTTNSPGQRRSIPLSEVVLRWEGAVQREVMRRKEAQLRQLYQHAPTDLLPVVAEGYRTVRQYAAERFGRESDTRRRSELESRYPVVAARTSRRLRELDRKVAALQAAAPRR